MQSSHLNAIEAEIDSAFADNELAKLPFAQGVWTLLSVVEDLHFKITVISPLGPREAAIYVDGLMNAMTYPLRVCYQQAVKGSFPFKCELIDEHYELAHTWLDVAEDYVHFCSIFPLYHANQIELRVEGSELIPTDWSATDLSYEVYDHFVAKRDPEQEQGLDPNLINSLNHQLRWCDPNRLCRSGVIKPSSRGLRKGRSGRRFV